MWLMCCYENPIFVDNYSINRGFGVLLYIHLKEWKAKGGLWIEFSDVAIVFMVDAFTLCTLHMCMI
jgi:hypothetical protein